MNTYELLYVVEGVPYIKVFESYKVALLHCALLENDKLTDKYELMQIIKRYERKNTQDRPQKSNNTSNKYKDSRTCENNTCQHKKVCKQLQLI